MTAKHVKLLACALLALGASAQAANMSDKPMPEQGMQEAQKKEMMMDGKKASKPAMQQKKKSAAKMGQEPMAKPAEGKDKM